MKQQSFYIGEQRIQVIGSQTCLLSFIKITASLKITHCEAEDVNFHVSAGADALWPDSNP